MTASPVDVGVCVPVLDERDALGALLDDLARTFDGGRYTVCIVDDGSTDGTRDLVADRARSDPRIHLLARTKTGPGCRRGGASRAGLAWLLENTAHTHFTDVDADGAHRPDEVVRALGLAARLGADAVIASKYVPGAVVTGRPLARRAGSRAYNLLLRGLLAPHLHDYSNTFRTYSRAAAELTLRYEPLFDTPVYMVEMVAIWLSHGLRVVEMPTTYVERRLGASKVVPADFVRGASGALRVGWAYRSGRYR